MLRSFIAAFSLVVFASFSLAQSPPSYQRPGSNEDLSAWDQSDVSLPGIDDLVASMTEYEVWSVETATLAMQYKIEYFDVKSGVWKFVTGREIVANRAPDLLFDTRAAAQKSIDRMQNNGNMRSFRIVDHVPAANWRYVDTFNDYDTAADFAWAIIHGTDGEYLAKVETVNGIPQSLKND